jgi:CRISPR system Cascade subunit CasA
MTEAWIPVVWRDATPGRVSLREAFARGEDLRDLAVRPHERIALMRLLICVAQAALGGPADGDEWESCRPRIALAAFDYLERWQRAFELFGSGQRFLQVAKLRKADNTKKPTSEANGEDDGTSTSKLDLALATGNNTTLFDNTGGSGRFFTPGDLALMLLTYQCFSPGGRIGVAEWNGVPTVGKGSSDHAPCLACGMLHAMPRGDSLLETVHRNLMTKRQADRFFGKGLWGRPVWEMMPERPGDSQAERNATSSYLGRLVPLARSICLADDGRTLLLANGFKYAPYPSWREPTTSVVVRKNKNGQPERQLIRASIEKAAWRELHALTVKTVSQNSNGGPAALENVGHERAFDLWVGSLVANKAKPVDTTESVLHVPAAMLAEPGQRAYEKGVQHAETTTFRVKRAISVYHKELGDNLDRPELKKRRLQIQYNAIAQFWTDVEGSVPRLLEIATDPSSLGLDEEWHNTAWGQAVWRAARDAYVRACPHETKRQIRAYALGLRALAGVIGGQPEDDAEKEADE